ncbi:UNVERIFIED_CONTAM: hypothetical protein K2H54_055133 [Gekko kuhli]
MPRSIGAPEKLVFFVVRVQKFVMNWGHLFKNDEQRVDYIASRLHDEAADWYVELHNMNNPELCTVNAFMWSLRAHYEDQNARDHARVFLCIFRQGKKTVYTLSVELGYFGTECGAGRATSQACS